MSELDNQYEKTKKEIESLKKQIKIKEGYLAFLWKKKKEEDELKRMGD